jgi:4-amino-4-deoxy-L-arabinose transferase-like glycosyltransferase
MPIAALSFFVLVSIVSLAFIVHRYRVATPAQRRQLVLAGVGAGVGAIAMGAFVYFR